MSEAPALSAETAPLSGAAWLVSLLPSVSESLQAVLTTAPSNNKRLRGPLSHEHRLSGENALGGTVLEEKLRGPNPCEENQRDIMG